MPFDVLTVGRVGVDVHPLQAGAVAAARYGHSAAVLTKTGQDPFGDFVRQALDGYGVDSRFVGTSGSAPDPDIADHRNRSERGAEPFGHADRVGVPGEGGAPRRCGTRPSWSDVPVSEVAALGTTRAAHATHKQTQRHYL